MPIDINGELETIENDEYLMTVRNAVHDGAAKVNRAYRADITEELETIRKGRYGIDIRMAIHDALEKLANGSQTGGTGGDVIIAQPVGGGGPNLLINHQIIGTFEREDSPDYAPRTAEPEMPGSQYYPYRVFGSTEATIPDEYYGEATAVAILLYQNGVEITKPAGWELVNDPSEANITYTPEETPTNLFNAATWLNGGTGVSGLYYFQNCSGTKDATNGKLTLTLNSMNESAVACPYPYRVDPSDPSHPPYKVSVTSGLSYIFECDVSGANSRVVIYANGDATKIIVITSQSAANDKLTARFTVPPAISTVTFAFQVYGPATSGTKVTFSNISLKVDPVDQRIAIYQAHLGKADKTSNFTFFAQTPTNDRCHLECALLVKSGTYYLTALDHGTINDVTYTHTSIGGVSGHPMLYAFAAPGWYGSDCAIQRSGGLNPNEKLFTADYMRLSATYDAGHIPLQEEPTFTSAFPVTTGFNGTMQYYLMEFGVTPPATEETEEESTD